MRDAEGFMIVVTVRLDSANGPQFDKNLFTMVIANDGTGTRLRGNYDIRLGRRGDTNPPDIYFHPLRKGRVENHPRKSTHVGSLVRKALQAVNL